MVSCSANEITIRGTSPNAADVVLDGQGKSRIFISHAASNTFENITFRGGYGEFIDNQWGNRWRNSAVYLAGSSGNESNGKDSFATLNNCVFDSCTNMYYSGAALTVDGGARLTNCVFTNCYDSAHGGPEEGNNNGTLDGGVVFIIPPTSSENVELTGCKFVDNAQVGKGYSCIGYGTYNYSRLLATNATGVILRNCDFIRNTNANSGGVSGAKVIFVDGCNFVSNHSAKGVSALRYFEPSGGGNYTVNDKEDYIRAITNQLLNSKFIGNITGDGGESSNDTSSMGVFTPGMFKNMIISNCEFKLNVAPRGVAYRTMGLVHAMFLDKLTMVDCLLEGNRSTLMNETYAGISYVPTGTMCDMLRCTCITNVAQSWASGLHCGSNSTVRLCKFIGNSYTTNNGDRFGGALFFEGATNYVEGCLFANNSNRSSWGSCINCEGNDKAGRALRIWNCTFVNNGGLALYAYHGSTVTEENLRGCEIGNCIFYGNDADFRHEGWQGVQYCYGPNVVNGKLGSIKGSEPKFINAANGDFTLLRTSPCRNAGQNADWMTTAVDLLGAPRLDPVYSRVDMGCYELITPFGMTIQLR